VSSEGWICNVYSRVTFSGCILSCKAAIQLPCQQDKVQPLSRVCRTTCQTVQMVFVSWGKDTSFNVCCKGGKKKDKIAVFWEVTLCSSLHKYKWFGGTYCLHLLGRKANFMATHSRRMEGGEVPVCAMKGCSRNRGIAPLILCHGTRWRWVVSIKPRLLYVPKKETQYQLHKLAVPQSRFRHLGEEIKLILLPGIKPRTVQYRVLYPGSLENLIPPKILTWLWVMPVYLRATIWVTFTSRISYTLNTNACTLPC
jgi:hypothetical protein